MCDWCAIGVRPVCQHRNVNRMNEMFIPEVCDSCAIGVRSVCDLTADLFVSCCTNAWISECVGFSHHLFRKLVGNGRFVWIGDEFLHFLVGCDGLCDFPFCVMDNLDFFSRSRLRILFRIHLGQTCGPKESRQGQIDKDKHADKGESTRPHVLQSFELCASDTKSTDSAACPNGSMHLWAAPSETWHASNCCKPA